MSITLKWEGMGFEHCMGLSERERESIGMLKGLERKV